MEAGMQKGLTPKNLARCLHLPERGRRVYGYRQLPIQGPQTARGTVGNPEAELPDSAPNHGDPGAKDGVGEGHPAAPTALAARYDGQRVHAGATGERAGDGGIGVRNAYERRGGKSAC